MNITDIRKIIREILSEGDVIDINQADLRKTVLDDIELYAFMEVEQKFKKDPREALTLQRILQGENKEKFLMRILSFLYKNVIRLGMRKRLTKKNSLSKEEELKAVEAGIMGALKQQRRRNKRI
jgi:hypothetical protein